MKRIRLLLLLSLTLAIPVVAAPRVEDDEEEDDDVGSSRLGDDEKKEEPKKEDPKKKKDDKKKTEEKKGEEKKEEKKEEPKKEEPKKEEAKKEDPKAKKGPVDVLAETDDEKKKRKAEDDARMKAEEAAAAADKKKADDKARLAEEKKAADDKRRVETREQRLMSAKKLRPLLREDGDLSVQLAVEPGAVVKGELVEIRLDVGRKLDIADPKFGNREPLKNLKLTATVTEPTGKKDAARVYAIHSLGAPGAYGFHLTPPKDGTLSIQILGDVEDKSINVTFPLHVGVWPPPDFDDEDKKLVAKGS